MNMKDTVILLMFLICILGLIIGVHYTEEIDNNNSIKNKSEVIYEDSNGVITISLEEKDNNVLHQFFTK